MRTSPQICRIRHLNTRPRRVSLGVRSLGGGPAAPKPPQLVWRPRVWLPLGLRASPLDLNFEHIGPKTITLGEASSPS